MRCRKDRTHHGRRAEIINPEAFAGWIRRYHESLDNLTPADVYFGRGQTILIERERIKRDTIRKRRLNHQAKAA